MKVEYIIIHHSLTKDSETVSWGAIRKYHTLVCGWKDIGYHYGIELINDQYEILVGRYEDQDGAHTKGWNRKALGICVVGNYDNYPVPVKMMNRLVDLVRYLMATYDVMAPRVIGHREAYLTSGQGVKIHPDKSCPGENFHMEHFRTLIA